MGSRRVGCRARRRHGLPHLSRSPERSMVRGCDCRLECAVSSYVELHAASAFSFLQGASLPEALGDRAAELGCPALALVDRDGVYGAPRFHKAATAAGIKPIIGAELTIERTGRAGACGHAERGPEKPERSISVSSRWGWGPSA